MPFNTVVILGGGPIGLLCAIEAKKYFRDVLIIEKRSGYSRNNVPALNEPLLKHLKEIGVSEDLWPKGQPGSTSLSFKRLEECLWKKAQADGVTMERGYVVSELAGWRPRENDSYKWIFLTLSAWDDKSKKIAAEIPQKFIRADLLVVASGGGAAIDPIVRDTLGFSFSKLKAKNYAAYGIFAAPTGEPDYSQQDKFRGLFTQVISDQIAFPTKDHNYLLIQLGRCTRSDYQFLKTNTGALHTLLTTVSAGYQIDKLGEIKKGEKNTAVFEVTIQRARHLRSENYPAVIVGDAAVTPHPKAGTGLETGFIGVQQVSLLFQELQNTNPLADNNAIWNNFDRRYDLFVSKKALEGTEVILINLLGLVDRFMSDMRDHKLSKQDTELILKTVYEQTLQTATGLRQVLAQQRSSVRIELTILQEAPEMVDWVESGIDRLWAEIGDTYKAVKKLTADIGLFQARIEEFEEALADRQ